MGGPEPAYTVAAQDIDDHMGDGGYILHAKAPGGGGPALTADQVELVHLGEAASYGAMWRSRPPSYNANQSSTPPVTDNVSIDTQMTRFTVSTPGVGSVQGSPVIVPPGSPRIPMESTLHAQIGIKLGPDGRLHANSHVYESPKFLTREHLPEELVITDHDNG